MALHSFCRPSVRWKGEIQVDYRWLGLDLRWTHWLLNIINYILLFFEIKDKKEQPIQIKSKLLLHEKFPAHLLSSFAVSCLLFFVNNFNNFLFCCFYFKSSLPCQGSSFLSSLWEQYILYNVTANFVIILKSSSLNYEEISHKQY